MRARPMATAIDTNANPYCRTTDPGAVAIHLRFCAELTKTFSPIVYITIRKMHCLAQRSGLAQPAGYGVEAQASPPSSPIPGSDSACIFRVTCPRWKLAPSLAKAGFRDRARILRGRCAKVRLMLSWYLQQPQTWRMMPDWPRPSPALIPFLSAWNTRIGFRYRAPDKTNLPEQAF